MGNGNALPSFVNYGGRNMGTERITLHHQAIIPSYEFTCCGNVTEWGVDLQPGGNVDDGLYTLNLQVWRPSPTTVDDSTGSGQYILVGNNRFTSISLSEGVAPSLQVTPSVQNQAQFQPGDVLGFYVERARNSDRGVNMVITASYTSETVWYASVATLYSIGCPISAGSSGVLNSLFQGAPVISIETGLTNNSMATSYS